MSIKYIFYDNIFNNNKQLFLCKVLRNIYSKTIG